MFERYTEKARRAIFFARYEASQFGSPTIETEFLLLGLIREDKALSNRFLRAEGSFESIRKHIEGHTAIRESISTSVDLPLANDCKRVVAYAAEEADRLSHKHIGTEHLLLGILREEKSFAAELLRERGVALAAVRVDLANTTHSTTTMVAAESTSLTGWSRDLTQVARNGRLDPILGRDMEIDGVIEILCCGYKKNALLLGARGAGKTAIVEGLAQRIAEGKIPLLLADKKIIALRWGALGNGPRERQRFDELMRMVTGEGNAGSIVCIDGVQSDSEEAATLNRLLRAGVQCIGIMQTRHEEEQSAAGSWADEFRAVYVGPLDKESALAVLAGRKKALEALHGVIYTEEALQLAVQAAASYQPEDALPGKALDLLDAAGSRAKLHQPAPPVEIAEIESHLRSIVIRTETAIANHEFEKARYYSEEERMERARLEELREKHHLGDAAALVVGPDVLKEVIARWTAYPYRP